jgi:hypothetical protein
VLYFYVFSISVCGKAEGENLSHSFFLKGVVLIKMKHSTSPSFCRGHPEQTENYTTQHPVPEASRLCNRFHPPPSPTHVGGRHDPPPSRRADAELGIAARAIAQNTHLDESRTLNGHQPTALQGEEGNRNLPPPTMQPATGTHNNHCCQQQQCIQKIHHQG